MADRFMPYPPADDGLYLPLDRQSMQRTRALITSNQALLTKVAALERKLEALEAQFVATPCAGPEATDASSFATTSYTIEDRLASLEGFKSVWQVLLDYLYNVFGKCSAFEAYERWYWNQGQKKWSTAAGRSSSCESSVMVEDSCP